MKIHKKMNSPLGKIVLQANCTGSKCEGLLAIWFDKQQCDEKKSNKDNPHHVELGQLDESDPILVETETQLNEYFLGKRREFSLPIAITVGTPFQQKVWQTLTTIPYGDTWSYQALAKAIGNPKATQAVGGANGKNPLSIIVPCHRVIGKNGQLTGYAGGIEIKEALLKLEGAMD